MINANTMDSTIHSLPHIGVNRKPPIFVMAVRLIVSLGLWEELYHHTLLTVMRNV